MIKYIGVLVFTFFIIIYNDILIFYMNLCYILGLVLILNYSLGIRGGWLLIRMNFGMDRYSFFIILLRFWILGLIYLSILGERGVLIKYKVLAFRLILLILVIYFSTFNFLLMYLFFEFRLIPTFFIVLYWGNNIERVEAGFYLLIYIILVSIPLFFYIIRLYLINYTVDLNLIGVCMFDLGSWEFLIVIGAFLIKLPIYLFHIWLPKAHVEAPVYGSMILAAVLLKLGGYGLLRLMFIFVNTCLAYRRALIRLGLIGSLYVRILCLVQSDMKRLVAYSSVVHINFILCSLFTLVKLGTWGSYIIMITHGLCSSGLFYIVNIFYQRSFSRLLVLNKGYLRFLSTVLIWWFLICASNFSFPFSLNFLGEILIIMSIIRWRISLGIIVSLICFFRGAYSLYLFSIVGHGDLIRGLQLSDSVRVLDHLGLVLHYFPLLVLILNALFL